MTISTFANEKKKKYLKFQILQKPIVKTANPRDKPSTHSSNSELLQINFEYLYDIMKI